jgi:hypothetical protein
MVPFSFKSELSYSRVMNEYSIGVLDDGINGFLNKWVQRHAGLESGAFALSCLLAFLMVIPAWAKICKNSNEFAKIQVNPTKSNQFYGTGMNTKIAKGERFIFEIRARPSRLPAFLIRKSQFVNRRSRKLPNEPNLKTALPAIPASCEGQPEEIFKAIIFNNL